MKKMHFCIYTIQKKAFDIGNKTLERNTFNDSLEIGQYSYFFEMKLLKTKEFFYKNFK
jgi:hypothetical protein